jgi:hypothetical protein
MVLAGVAHSHMHKHVSNLFLNLKVALRGGI